MRWWQFAQRRRDEQVVAEEERPDRAAHPVLRVEHRDEVECSEFLGFGEDLLRNGFELGGVRAPGRGEERRRDGDRFRASGEQNVLPVELRLRFGDVVPEVREQRGHVPGHPGDLRVDLRAERRPRGDSDAQPAGIGAQFIDVRA